MRVRRWGRFISFLIFLTFAFAAVIYLLAVFFSPLPETIVPDVIGLSENEAVFKIEKMGLTPKVEARSSQSNIVTNQKPEPGKIVKAGRVVFIILGKSGVENPTPSAVVITPLLTLEGSSSPEVQIEVIQGDKND